MRFNALAFGAIAFFLLNIVDAFVSTGFGLFYFMMGVVFMVFWAVRETRVTSERPNAKLAS